MSESLPSAEKDVRRVAAEREVRDRFPGLMYERSRLRSAGIEPTRVLLPARLNVPYEGEDATDFEGSCMGLPITWSDREEWGLIVTLPEPRTTVLPSAEGRPVQGCMACATYRAEGRACPSHRVLPPAECAHPNTRRFRDLDGGHEKCLDCGKNLPALSPTQGRAVRMDGMSTCPQELCPNWSGDGRVCMCDLIDVEPPPCQHEHYIEDEWGNRLCVRCDHEWWEDPL